MLFEALHELLLFSYLSISKLSITFCESFRLLLDHLSLYKHLVNNEYLEWRFIAWSGNICPENEVVGAE